MSFIELYTFGVDNNFVHFIDGEFIFNLKNYDPTACCTTSTAGPLQWRDSRLDDEIQYLGDFSEGGKIQNGKMKTHDELKIGEMRAVELCEEHGLDAEDLVYGWVAYSTAKGRCLPSVAALEAMVRAKLSGKQKPRTSSGKTPAETQAPKVYTKDTIDQLTPIIMSNGSPVISQTTKRQSSTETATPKRGSAVPIRNALFSPTSYSPTAAVPCERYGSRTGRGDVVTVFGTAGTGGTEAGAAVTVSVLPECLSTSFRYMFDTLQERADVLNERILELGQQIRLTNGLTELSQPHTVSQEPVDVVGRIGCDGKGRLNSKSILLQGGQGVYGEGRCVELDVSKLHDTGLFPGQVVAARGVNPTGNSFYTSQLYTSALPPPTRPPQLQHDVVVMVACGPFTTTEDLQYDPLKDLLTEVSIHKPHLLVLQGPFIDNKIVDNELAETYDQLWERLLRLIADSVKDLHTRVLIQSSVQDVHGEPVLPTPPLSCQSQLSEQLQPVANPSCVRVDTAAAGDEQGLLVAFSSTDVLMHLSQQEIKLPGSGGSDRFARLAGYILEQRCFYPLYPSDDGVGVDLHRWKQYCTISNIPHLLILPSDFKAFVKEVHGCVVINPSRLVRGVSGGTYALLNIPAAAADKFSQNVSVKIIKI